jgi:hypothetical protein
MGDMILTVYAYIGALVGALWPVWLILLLWAVIDDEP